MEIYLVGGAVRDALLGIDVFERDYVVVGANAEQLKRLGFIPLNADFPVFRHPETGDEYALARRERKVGLGYKGFVVETGPDVTLEEDLARRDLTVNAIAQSTDGCIIDPFNGRADLKTQRLRHITPAFQEDPVRLLRIARFVAKLGHLGFRICHETFNLLRFMAKQEELVTLVPQKLRDELLRALALTTPTYFFTTLHRCGALAYLLPPLAAAIGTIPAAHEDISSYPLYCLQRATAITENTVVRFASIIGSAVKDPVVGMELCKKLQIERAFADILTCVQTWDASKIAYSNGETLLQFFESRRLLHRPQNLESIAQAWSALDPEISKIALTRANAALRAVFTVNSSDLRSTGLIGQAFGNAIRRCRLQAIEEVISYSQSTIK